MKFLSLLLVFMSFNVFSHIERRCERNCYNRCETRQPIHCHEHKREEVKKPKPEIKWRTKYVYVNVPQAPKKAKPVKPKVITKVKTKIKKVYVKPKRKKNSISLLGVAAKTDYEVIESATSTDVDKQYEADFGVMYQRDVSESIRFSIGGTVNGTGMIGLGWNY